MKNITCEIPKNNKEVFLEPAIEYIPELILENRHKIRDYKFEINGVPFQVLRDKTRMEVLRLAACYTNGIKSLLRKDKSGLCLYVRNSAQKSASWLAAQDKLYINELTLDYEKIKNIPIIQTGHEPILYHPGIWIKNHLVQYLVNKLDGIGVNMIVDNDACNMGFMYVPILSEVSASVGKVAFVKNKDHVAYEEIVFDDFEPILQFKEEVINLLSKNILCEREDVKTTMEDMQGMFEQFINCLWEYYQQGCSDMVGLLTAARRSLEEGFGIENLVTVQPLTLNSVEEPTPGPSQEGNTKSPLLGGDLGVGELLQNLELPVSWMCDTDGFYHFLLHILYEAERFAKIYNEKLAEYRSIHKTRSNANPLPDLKILRNLIEVPFWVWKAEGQRAKCYRVNEGEDIKITDGVDILVILKKSEGAMENLSRLKVLMDAGIKIRPRAVTTTMFSRMFFSDVFIHGIGGAKYDAITDEIIKEFFGIDPPGFVTVSATLFLPLDVYGLDIKELQELQRTDSDMCYNPERYASKETQSEPAFMNRVKEKQRLLKIMGAGNADEKRRYFRQIKELNKLMLSQIHTELQKKQREINITRDKLAYNEIVRFREYPVYLYPTKILKDYLLNVFS